MLSVGPVAEILAYCIPVVDNFLDSLATPAAFIAGTVASAADRVLFRLEFAREHYR
jgi:Domain of unknown function (DUF4126)